MFTLAPPVCAVEQHYEKRKSENGFYKVVLGKRSEAKYGRFGRAERVA